MPQVVVVSGMVVEVVVVVLLVRGRLDIIQLLCGCVQLFVHTRGNYNLAQRRPEKSEMIGVIRGPHAHDDYQMK